MTITKQRLIELLEQSDIVFEESPGNYSTCNTEDTILNPYIDRLYDLLKSELDK